MQYGSLHKSSHVHIDGAVIHFQDDMRRNIRLQDRRQLLLRHMMQDHLREPLNNVPQMRDTMGSE
ncbi:hypothetical protein GW15_0222410 [Xanthomonas axonopodis pv. vasculorum]|uniref:Uncharacterized protein n=1 Tax=Xanthomonas axonopodis pv. vasculorum TaxID=325777 RepID=A0A098PUC7_9XANT|nr:hypothetical protein GW15_0222410 [Xanthomonas axonopodis pv. vasculorum]